MNNGDESTEYTYDELGRVTRRVINYMDSVDDTKWEYDDNGDCVKNVNSYEGMDAEEGDDMPTVAVNGRFMVKNADGLWEIYTTDKKPKKIGGEYLYASLFYEDVAPVVEKGQPVKFIDRDGNVKVTLDKINGKAVWTEN